MKPNDLTLTEAVGAIQRSEITSTDLVEACLSRVAEVDSTVEAWAFLDPEYARKQAADADAKRAKGEAVGLLHGVPIGVKDLFDTADMPTEYGSRLWAGHSPKRDAAVVERLRAAGAIVIGKTVTTEYAYFQPGKTRNPHDPQRTPGGSSSGSAAAVAAHMVPGAIGTQTTGSIIRPASYCGVVGYKPSFGSISRAGALMLSHELDQVGVFARTVPDVALLAQTLMGSDARDSDARDYQGASLVDAASDHPRAPRFAFVRTPLWPQAEPDSQAKFAEFVSGLADFVTDVDLDSAFTKAVDFQRLIMEFDIAKNYSADLRRGRDLLSQSLQDVIERGAKHTPEDYQAAVERRPSYLKAIDDILDQYDAILTPSVPGEAPIASQSTGSPIFCTIWSYLGVPTISLPILKSSQGMAIGVQMVAKRGADADLLRNASWLSNHCSFSHG